MLFKKALSTIFILFIAIGLISLLRLNTTIEEVDNLSLEELLVFADKPWGEDPRFKKSIVRYKTYILLAEYEAQLKEPLPGELFNVAHGAKMLAGTVVEPGEIFSQNKTIGPYIHRKGYQSGPMYKGAKVVEAQGGGVCKIASLLYNVAIQSNLEIIERYNHSMTVPYVPLGQDATVFYGAKDLRFRNTTSGPLLIWAQTVDNTLYMALYGQEKPPQVTWHHEILQEIKYWNNYLINPRLPKGTEKVIIPGQDGYIVSSWITILQANGQEEKKYLGKDYYNPLPQLIEKNN